MIKDFYGIMENNKPISKAEYIGLLNILQANQESIDDFYNVANNRSEFCGIYKMSGSYNDNSEVYSALMAHHIFLSDKAFIDWILERIQEEVESGNNDYSQLIHDYTYNNSDTQIYKTNDGYVIRFDY